MLVVTHNICKYVQNIYRDKANDLTFYYDLPFLDPLLPCNHH